MYSIHSGQKSAQKRLYPLRISLLHTVYDMEGGELVCAVIKYRWGISGKCYVLRVYSHLCQSVWDRENLIIAIILYLPIQSHDESRGQYKGVFITPHRMWSITKYNACRDYSVSNLVISRSQRGKESVTVSWWSGCILCFCKRNMTWIIKNGKMKWPAGLMMIDMYRLPAWKLEIVFTFDRKG